MTSSLVTIKKFMELTGLSENMVRRRIRDGRLNWVKDGYLYMIDINAYNARLEVQRKATVLRPLSTLPPGGLITHIENEQRRRRLKGYQQGRLL